MGVGVGGRGVDVGGRGVGAGVNVDWGEAAVAAGKAVGDAGDSVAGGVGVRAGAEVGPGCVRTVGGTMVDSLEHAPKRSGSTRTDQNNGTWQRKSIFLYEPVPKAMLRPAWVNDAHHTG